MAEAGEIWIDGAIGETRRVVLAAGRPARIEVARWSDAGRRARWGETYAARIRAIAPALGGAFLDLGLGEEQGFLPFEAHGHIRLGPNAHRRAVEGETILVRIAREGAGGKSPVAAFVQDAPAHPALGRIAKAERDEDAAAPADPELREKIDAALDLALARIVPLRGGGRLIIERTAALTAIDVDSAGRRGSADAEAFACALNIEAAGEALAQLIARGEGGLAAIDFVSLRRSENRRAVEAALKQAARSDPWGVAFAPMSRFCVVELSRPQLMRPLREILCDETGAKTAETIALEALRALEREARAARGRRLIARLPRAAADWLEGETIPWRSALSARIGSLWEIEAVASGAQERIDVRAL